VKFALAKLENGKEPKISMPTAANAARADRAVFWGSSQLRV
jgi:hypothetical protein